ncbi:unnamed protein product [Cyclocybe aegerita]|uniref:Peptidase A1 domain-containing protein n=1 Tax=Cyclocybe aegerita TaxID=1973307 RepID=A0A8S0W538_CYCAE|nr:unnamed protein product [Cyclocybe aegerita]
MAHAAHHTLPFEARIKHGAKHILAHDRARAQKLMKGLHPHGPMANLSIRDIFHHHHGGSSAPSTEPPQPAPVPPAGDPEAASNSIDVTDAGVTYTMPIGVGNPPTQYTLLIDTGSSNTWVGADKEYKPTSTSHSTRNQVNVTYGSGSFTGTEYEDQISLGGNLVIQKQSVGVASKATGFQGVDGILGIGPVGLTVGTVHNTRAVPTVTDNLFQQKMIPTESIGISFNPTTANGSINGELTFGGTDLSRFSKDVNYVPITKTSPASHYWGIDQTISYGKNMPILKSRAGIVDTGTTLLMIASDAFKAYEKATGATMDRTTGLLTVTEEQFGKMESLFFEIGSTAYELIPDAQIWPRALNDMLGGEAGKIYLIVADMGTNSGSGLDFINGFGFLQRFYSVYDTTNNRVGLANTPFTMTTTN